MILVITIFYTIINFRRQQMNIEKYLEEIRRTALKHANPKDPAIQDWQYVHALAYDLLRSLEEE